MKDFAYFKGDLCLRTPLLFEKVGDEYVMLKDKSFWYPAVFVEEEDDWIKFTAKEHIKHKEAMNNLK